MEVSIICNAYNHEKYIKEALEGFVMQITSFPFEVLIHDDASTDGTANIIREYEKKYPDIVKPIYSMENQYSKRDGSLQRIQYGRVTGKYIAVCEGDDYWTDPNKLQKQYDALEMHPEVNICAHATRLRKKNKFIGKVAPADKDAILSVEDVILGGGGFVSTASLMYRTEVRRSPIDLLSVLSLDYTIQIQGSLPNGMLFLRDTMAVYRVLTEGSWNVRMKVDSKALIAHREKLTSMLIKLDEGTENKYHQAIKRRISQLEYANLLSECKYKDMLSGCYRGFFNELPLKQKILVFAGCLSPKIINWIKLRIQKNEC